MSCAVKFLIATLCGALMTGAAAQAQSEYRPRVPPPKPPGVHLQHCTARVCVKYAPGSPGTFAGPCLRYETRYVACGSPVP